jgi:hypothetical protein
MEMTIYSFTATRSIGFSVEGDTEEEARENAAACEEEFDWNEAGVYCEITLDKADAPAKEPGTLEINRELVVSTAHVSKQTMDWLLGGSPDGYETFDLPGGDSVEYGALVWTGGSASDPDSLPPDLSRLIALAREHDCKWLRLDCDGLTVEGFQKFDW